MGYWPRRENVDEFQHILEQIRIGVEANAPTFIAVPSVGSVANTLHRLRQAMVAAQTFPEMYSGRYARLKALVTLKMDASSNQIIAEPKAGAVMQLVATPMGGEVSEDEEMDEVRAALEQAAARAASQPKQSSFQERMKNLGYSGGDDA